MAAEAGDTIYVITRGSYSDYHIVCIVPTREAAEEMIEDYLQVAGEFEREDFRIEEYTVLEEHARHFRHRVYMDILYGDILEHEDDWNCGPVFVPESELSFHGPRLDALLDDLDDRDVVIAAVGRDFEHAVKVAADFRRSLLANPHDHMPAPGPNAGTIHNTVWRMLKGETDHE